MSGGRSIAGSRPGAVVQARLGSTRLPGKVLAPIGDRPMIARVLERLRRSRRLEGIVVAVPASEGDSPLTSACRALGVPVVAGDEHDVLDRTLVAARACRFDPVVRVTSDCPLIDPDLVDRAIAAWLTVRTRGVDLVSNTRPRLWPRGLDVEVVSLAALEALDRLERDPSVREHVTLGIYRRPGVFRLAGLAAREDHSHLRWTVDTDDDLRFVRAVYRELEPSDPRFGWRDVLALLESRPELRRINAGIRQKEISA